MKAVVGIAAALAGVLLIAWIGGAFDGDDDELVPVVTTPVTVPVAVTTAPATTAPATTAPATTAP